LHCRYRRERLAEAGAKLASVAKGGAADVMTAASMSAGSKT